MTVHTPRIVVIDETPSSLSIYERSTSSLAVEVRSFLSPRDSLSYLLDNEADLIFLDILMREKDGLGVLKSLREIDRHQDTNVVIVTSKDYHQDRAVAKQWGALEYLLKPLRSQEIREIICKYTGAKNVQDDSLA